MREQVIGRGERRSAFPVMQNELELEETRGEVAAVANAYADADASDS